MSEVETTLSSPHSSNALLPAVPVRIQRSRQHKQVSPNGLPIVYVGRPGKWGNPFSLKSAYVESAIDLHQMDLHYKDPKNEGARDWNGYARALVIRNYKTYLEKHPEIVERAKMELKGKNLSCWCKVGEPCHADVLLEIANR